MKATLDKERAEAEGLVSAPPDQQVRDSDFVERTPELPAFDDPAPGASALDSAACDALAWLGRQFAWERRLEILHSRRSMGAS